MSDAGNWDNGAPTGKVCVIAGTDPITVDSYFDVTSLITTGYTGTLSDADANNTIVTYADCTLSAGTVIDCPLYINSGNFDPQGASIRKLTMGNTGEVINFLSSCTVTFQPRFVSTCTIHWGTSVLTWVVPPGTGGDAMLEVSSASIIDYSPGGKIVIQTVAGGSLDDGDEAYIYGPQNTVVFPPIEITGDGPVVTMSDAKFSNLTIGADVQFLVAPADWFDGSAQHVDCAGNFLTYAPIFGSDETGHAAVPLVDCPVTVTGTALAHDCTITGLDFSGGTRLNATDGCTDGLGNTAVDFPEEEGGGGDDALTAARPFMAASGAA